MHTHIAHIHDTKQTRTTHIQSRQKVHDVSEVSPPRHIHGTLAVIISQVESAVAAHENLHRALVVVGNSLVEGSVAILQGHSSEAGGTLGDSTCCRTAWMHTVPYMPL